MRITYEPSTDCAYIYLTPKTKEGGVAHTYACDPQEVKGQIHLDFDHHGKLIGIELLDASRLLSFDLLKKDVDDS